MPRLIIKTPQQKNFRFELPAGDTLIGRGEECRLKLPNVSVSREHARVKVTKAGATIEDLGSQNGVLVNGKPVQQHTFKAGDEVQVGSYSLIYLTSRPEDRFYRGRFVEHLPAYDATTSNAEVEDHATFALSRDAILKMQQGSHLVETARIVSQANTNQFWYPQDKPFTFGSTGMVPVEGWFMWGVVAQVVWDGSRHFLEKKAWWVTTTLNGTAVQRVPLVHNAVFNIGSNRFKYDAPPLK